MSAIEAQLQWRDGQPWSSRFDDRYFSAGCGLEEARHVFLDGNALARRFAGLRDGECFTIGETGFGTGLNFLCAWQLFEAAAPPGAVLEFRSVECAPLPRPDLQRALALWPALQAPAAALCAAWPATWAAVGDRWRFAAGRIDLRLSVADVGQTLPAWPDATVDAWFLDGFAPAKNPQMWSAEVLAQVARGSRSGATLATFTSAGWVRRGLAQAGFEVRRVPGFGRKRQMTIGQRRR